MVVYRNAEYDIVVVFKDNVNLDDAEGVTFSFQRKISLKRKQDATWKHDRGARCLDG